MASKSCMRRHFETEQWLPLPLPVVFAFFANPANLPPLMPAWQKARIDKMQLQSAAGRPSGGPDGVAAGNDTEITITARALPWIPLRAAWLARIEDFRWNEGFCDVQVKGPFRFWRHCHSVRTAPESSSSSRTGTVVRDAVEYELPLGGNSSLIDQKVILPIFRELFKYRQKQAERLLLPESFPM